MTYNEFKQNFLAEFLNIKSFAGRMKYANEHLTRIGSGSGRIVYDIDGEKVLKIAKNPKGVAQNEAEGNAGRYNDTHNIVTIVFEEADNGEWLISEKAKKVNEKRIKELTGIPSLNDLYSYLRNSYDSNRGKRPIFRIDDDIVQFLNENEFAQELHDFIGNYKQSPGDMGRPSTFGEVLRDGQPTIVLTDSGLNDNVYDTHYNPERKEKHQMYELYNFLDGNDDILSDVGNTDEIRYSMAAVIPYSVGDGDGVINEKFVSFVSNRDKYPNKVLESTPYMLDEFHNIVNNLKEVLDSVDDKKKFYNNLLELQDYLIRGKFYDREPLGKEMLSEDNITNVAPMSLEKIYSDEIADAFSAKMNLGKANYLGKGSYGHAYLISGNRVLKLTTDMCEVSSGGKIRKSKPQALVQVYNIYKVVDTEKNLALFALILDFIADKPKVEFIRLGDIVDTIAGDDSGWGFIDIMIMMKKNKISVDELIEKSKFILTANPEANVSQEDRQKTYKYMLGLYEIKRELEQLQIKSNDYSNPENIGYKNGILTYFDIGGCKVEEPQLPAEDIISLPENEMIPESEEMISEDYDRKTADEIANRIAYVRGDGHLNYIDAGMFGVAYDIGNNLVLKITKDRSEAMENLNLKGKPLKYIAIPYNVYEITPKNGDNMPETYAIVLEKLKTDKEKFKSCKERMNFAFEKIMKVSFADVIDHYLNNGEFGDDGVDEEKVQKYLSRNPVDKWYFDSILKIAEEARQYGVESMDYLNHENLGYKPNGELGFFDVGFGNYYASAEEKPEQIKMTEDASVLYSTPNSVGSLNLPTYDNKDSSPATDNDWFANSSNDDVELTERLKSAMPGSSSVDVKKKCRLAGNGNTSTACNQGDISNLKFGAINEYREQMEKVYGKTGVYDKEDMDAILSITGGDPYTKWIADNFYYLANRYNKKMVEPTRLSERDREILIDAHERIKRYDKNVLPIHDLYAQEHNAHPLEKMNDLRMRELIIQRLKQFPSVLLRNLRGDIRKEREHYELERVFQDVREIQNLLDMLGRVKPENREKIYKKVFSSTNDTFEDIKKRLDSTTIPYLSQDEDIDGMIEKVRDVGDEAEILYNKNNVLAVEIKSSDAMKQLGCSSQWCFATEHTDSYWNNYIYNDTFPKIIYNFNEEPSEEKRMVVLLPDNQVYNMYNDYIEDGDSYLDSLGLDFLFSHMEFVDDEMNEGLNESSIPNNTFWAWVSPENQFVQVPKLSHRGYIMGKYKHISGWDYDRVFDEAMKDGWVRVIYEKFPNDFRAELSLNGYSKDRVKQVFKTLFFDLVKYGNNRVFIDYEEPKGSEVFSTRDAEGKEKMVNYALNETGEGNAQPYDVQIVRSDEYDKDYSFQTEDGDKYLIKFSSTNQDENDWYVVFGIDSEFAHLDYDVVTNKGRLYRVMATILKIMKGFIINTKPNEILFEPTKKSPDDRGRFSMYLQFMKKQLPLEYEYVETDGEIIIRKKNNTLNEAQIMSLQDLPFKQEVEQLGGKIFSVGGAVRDEFLGKESKDLDVLITGVPMDNLEELLAKYGSVNNVGKSFGVIKFKPRGASEDIDIAIPRTEFSNGEGGHKGFEVTSDHALPIEKDLERRDFTINAIAKDAEGNIIDPYHGQEDLKNKVIRVVNPEAFSDDPLRMLRAVQFASRFGFTIEPNTMQMINDNAERVKEIAPERILIEFDKIVKKGNKLKGAFLLKSTGLLKNIFGTDTGLAINNNWDNIRTIGEFIWMLSHNLVQDPAEFFKKNLKGDTDNYKEINALELAFNGSEASSKVEARSIAHNMYLISPQSLQSQILPTAIQTAAQELLQGKYPKTVNELAINGNDLIQAGLQGKERGDAQKMLLLKVYSDSVENNREELLPLLNKNVDDKAIQEYANSSTRHTWDINGEEVDIDYFVKKYDEWNNQGYSDPSEASVLEFLQNNYGDYLHDYLLKKELLWALTDRDVLNESENKKLKYSDVKEALMKSKSISKEMKEEIFKYLTSGSKYHEGGKITGLIKPKELKEKSSKSNGVSMGADKDGFFVYTHRARSKSHSTPDKITIKEITFIDSTG